MCFKRCMIAWLIFIPSLHSEADFNQELTSTEERWLFKHKKLEEMKALCTKVHPTGKDIVRRFYAILPYFDREHLNTAFLHKMRATVFAMSEGEDVLDREVAFYATVLTPIVFLQQYRDTWCLLERFHRAIRLYQISHPTEKRAALKTLQNLRAVNIKIRNFVQELPGSSSPGSTISPLDIPEDDSDDKKDIKYLSELIKNLG